MVDVTNGYVTADELKATLSLTGQTFADDDIARAINAASRLIDDYCKRFFYPEAASTRYYTPATSSRVWTDDIQSVTTLKTDEDGDGTYEVTWATSDYFLEPRNAVADDRPYTSIHVTRQGSYSFPRYEGSVQIVGTFGWSAAPALVIEACRLQAAQMLRSSREAPMGVIQTMSLEGSGGAIRVGGKLDGRVATMLAGLRKNYPAVA